MSTVRFHVIHVLYISPCDCQHPLSYICLYVHVSLFVRVCPCQLSVPVYYCLYSLVILSTSISPCQLSLTTCPCLFPHVNCLFSHGTGIVCIHGLLPVSAFICLFIRVIVCIALSTVYNRVLLFLRVTVCNNVSTVFNFIDLLLYVSIRVLGVTLFIAISTVRFHMIYTCTVRIHVLLSASAFLCLYVDVPLYGLVNCLYPHVNFFFYTSYCLYSRVNCL